MNAMTDADNFRQLILPSFSDTILAKGVAVSASVLCKYELAGGDEEKTRNLH
jgi:hypothetical protein